MKIALKSFPVLFSVLFCMAFISGGCRKINANRAYILPEEYRPYQLVVWRKPGASTDAWDAKKAYFKSLYGTAFTVKKCSSCNDDLELWEGPSVQNFISTEVVSGGTRPRGQPSGEDAASYYSVNFIVRTPFRDQLPQITALTTQLPNSSNLPPITVGVFDTGDDPAITNDYTTVAVPSCKAGGDYGWNFVADNNDVSDEQAGKHGTVVSKFIVDEVEARTRTTGSPVNILPVKIFDRNGVCDLFDVLCGFSYAKNAGAKIINASFGFYYYKDAAGAEVPKILLEYTRKVLTSNNIILVAAAGNASPYEDSVARYLESDLTGSDLRNLNKHFFYPGGLSKYLGNVICVTTVNRALGRVSPTQNFSNTIVDIGTSNDISGTYDFIHPFNNTLTATGSSFATPVFTGKLCSWYNQVVTTFPINKETIITALKTKGVVFNDTPALLAFVKNGMYVQR